MSTADQNPSPVPGCRICEQVFARDRKAVYDTEHFVTYTTPVYPWSVVLSWSIGGSRAGMGAARAKKNAGPGWGSRALQNLQTGRVKLLSQAGVIKL